MPYGVPFSGCGRLGLQAMQEIGRLLGVGGLELLTKDSLGHLPARQ